MTGVEEPREPGGDKDGEASSCTRRPVVQDHSPRAARSFGRNRQTPPPLWLLGQIALGAVLAAHVIAPALPSIAHDFATDPRTMQMAVSIYVAGLAAGQLVYGPLAERFGERTILLFGIGLYTVASAAALFARDAPTLIAIRLVQSLGGAAGMVLARAIVRHGVDAREATRRLALMNLMMTLGPAIAPLIGSGATAFLGWRALFGGLAVLGIVNMAGTWALIPATPDRSAGMKTVLLNYGSLFTTPSFIGYALTGACLTTSMYAIIGTAPFILIGRFHLPVSHVGLVLAMATIGIWLGSMAASRLVRSVNAETLLAIGAACVATASFVLLALVMTDELSVASMVGDVALFLFGVGLTGPPALALAMGATPRAAASGSGVYGATQMAVGALCSFTAALAGDPAHGAALTVSVASTIGLLGLWSTRRSARRAGS